MKILFPPKFSALGFTIIELLIAMVVFGSLSTVVLVLINPGEQLARSRDSARISAVSQLGRAVQNYEAEENSFPDEGTDWISRLVNKGEVKSIPVVPSYGSSLAVPICTYASYAQGSTAFGYCYRRIDPEAIVYVGLESAMNDNKCQSPATEAPFYVFSTKGDRSGIVCRTAVQGEPQPGIQAFRE